MAIVDKVVRATIAQIEDPKAEIPEPDGYQDLVMMKRAVIAACRKAHERHAPHVVCLRFYAFIASINVLLDRLN